MIRRKKFLVKTTFQFKYAALLVFAILFVVAIVGWNLYYEAGSIMFDRTRSGDVVDLVVAYNRMLLRSLPIIILTVVGVSIFVSHQVAGPLVHLEKGMRQVSEGDLTENMKLRRGDEFKEIAEMFNDMVSGIKGLVIEDREQLQKIILKLEDLKNKIDKGGANPVEFESLIAELKKIGGSFKV